MVCTKLIDALLTFAHLLHLGVVLQRHGCFSPVAVGPARAVGRRPRSLRYCRGERETVVFVLCLVTRCSARREVQMIGGQRRGKLMRLMMNVWTVSRLISFLKQIDASARGLKRGTRPSEKSTVNGREQISRAMTFQVDRPRLLPFASRYLGMHGRPYGTQLHSACACVHRPGFTYEQQPMRIQCSAYRKPSYSPERDHPLDKAN